MPFPHLNFITHDPMESDYRPVVDATGRHVIFERTPRGDGVTTLFITSIGTPHGAEPFIHVLPAPTQPQAPARPVPTGAGPPATWHSTWRHQTEVLSMS